jgi:hypothetical protein
MTSQNCCRDAESAAAAACSCARKGIAHDNRTRRSATDLTLGSSLSNFLIISIATLPKSSWLLLPMFPRPLKALTYALPDVMSFLEDGLRRGFQRALDWRWLAGERKKFLLGNACVGR